jgi:pimeloyl-ACP methyl ester carboxylesterase
MTRLMTKTGQLFLTIAALLLCFMAAAEAQGATCTVIGAVETCNGTLPDGATFLIQIPATWNGTLFLYSHGYVVPGSMNPAQDVGDPATGAFMLAKGYALAGSSYAHTGWAIQEALIDQIAVLDQFNTLVGKKPARTIAWGHSLGGIITAGLIQRNPDRFAAALPMCGVLSGGVATWNTGLDGAFAFKVLVGDSSSLPGSTSLQVVDIQNPTANLSLAEAILAAAQTTPQGRARIALSAALGDLPGWFTPLTPEPAPTDFATQETNQFLWEQQVDFPFGFALRAELEARAGGNVSWNTSVDYRKQLSHSVDKEEVEALYQAAGLDLNADLDALNDAARISANEASVDYLEQNIIFNGQIHIPVLTLHTTGDGLVVVENESAYRDVVDEVGNQRFLRRTFVSRAGHCAFTPAETVTAVQNLIDRLDTGKWPHLDDGVLNAEAGALGPLNIFFAGGQIVPTPPAFVDFHPARYLRPFDALDECRVDSDDHECHGKFDF